MITIRRNVSSAGTRRSYGTRCALSWILHTRRSWRNVLQRLLMIPSRGNAIVMRCFEFHIDIPRGSNTGRKQNQKNHPVGIPNCCRRGKFSKKYRKVKVVPTQINCKKCLFKKPIPGKSTICFAHPPPLYFPLFAPVHFFPRNG